MNTGTPTAPARTAKTSLRPQLRLDLGRESLPCCFAVRDCWSCALGRPYSGPVCEYLRTVKSISGAVPIVYSSRNRFV